MWFLCCVCTADTFTWHVDLSSSDCPYSYCSFIAGCSRGPKILNSITKEPWLQKALKAIVFQLKGAIPQLRLKENPGESSIQSIDKKLFCNACREEVSFRTSSVKNHTHVWKKELKREEKRRLQLLLGRIMLRLT